MIQNLKVDIIYHRSSSDFEMEFNLCGCCRMRLLSDKTSDKKGFITALARDVARSRVIITCGPLFGADGLINMVGMAIGNGTTVCDNKTYGINDDAEINIINGSTPLVTPDGYFGGCIIESGPQTIILLTENKTFRKSIMQNLIHPYLEEICYIPVKASPIIPQEEVVPPPVLAADEGYLTVPDEEYMKEAPIDEMPAMSEEALSDEYNIDFIMDDGIEGDTHTEEAEPSKAFDDTYKMYTEVETQKEIEERYEELPAPSESDSMFIAAAEDSDDALAEKGKKGKDSIRSLNIAIVILVLLLLLACLALVYFIVLRPMMLGISTKEYLKEIFGLTKAYVNLI